MNAEFVVDIPDSDGFSKPLAKPFAPNGPLTMASGVVVETVDPAERLTTLPEFKVPVIPASFASVQPSPSESKSKLFGLPSPSKSLLQPTLLPIT